MHQIVKTRLICRNCDAQYEVPSDVIPPEGRDVQCSACGHGWYQYHPDYPDGDVSEPEETAAQDDVEPQSESGEDAPPVPPKPVDAGGAAPDMTRERPATDAPPPPRRELDPAVASVLRAEAELETRARRKEAERMETQPDLGLPDAARRPQTSGPAIEATPPTRQTPAGAGASLPAASGMTTGGKVTEFPNLKKLTQRDDPPADVATRRDRLPDIDEINSTLRANHDRSPTRDPGQTAQVEVRNERGARLGFSMTLALAAVLAFVYVFSPQLAEAVPDLAAPLERYVAAVDTARVWLGAVLAEVIAWLETTFAAVVAWVQDVTGGSRP